MTRQQTRFVSFKTLQTLGPRFLIFLYVLARPRTLTNLTKRFHVLYLFYQSHQIPPKYSTTKEIRAWISLCTVAGEIVNGLPLPMMVVDNAKAMMAVAVL
jgi:hypothetical protein